jgi:Zn-dependent protease with chaperone function
MLELAGARWRQSLSRTGQCGRHGHSTELLAVAVIMALTLSLAVPLGLLLWVNPGDGHTVNRLLNACQEGMRRGPFAVVGYAAAAILVSWAALTAGRLLVTGARDLRSILGKGRILAAQASEVECCAGGRALTISVLPTDMALAFTAGLVRPRIYLSRSLLRELPAAELEATLLHEAAHAARRDPLRCWLVELVLASLWYPRLSRLTAAHRSARELRADLHAIQQLGDDRPLLQALHKVDALAPAPGSCGLTSEREHALRALRAHGLGAAGGERLALLVGLSVVAALMLLAVAGLTDFQSYWFCPGSASTVT